MPLVLHFNFCSTHSNLVYLYMFQLSSTKTLKYSLVLNEQSHVLAIVSHGHACHNVFKSHQQTNMQMNNIS